MGAKGNESFDVEGAMNAGLYGTLIRSIYAHAQMDVDRSNPDSNSPGPAFLSQLSSVAVALERLGDPDAPVGAFVQTVASVSALLGNATAETGKSKSSRVAYALALLKSSC